MLSPIFVSPPSRQIASHASVGIESYSHWKKALPMYLLFFSWLLLLAITFAFSKSAIFLLTFGLISAIVLLEIVAATYLIIDSAVSSREHKPSFGQLIARATKITLVLLMFSIGFMLFIIPGYFLVLMFGFAPGYIARGEKLGASLKRSRELSLSEERETARALAFMLTIGAFLSPLLFVVGMLPMMTGIIASVVEFHPVWKYIPAEISEAPVIKSTLKNRNQNND